jgi:hypothetical protein
MAVVMKKIGSDDDKAVEKIDDDFQAGRCLIIPADESGFMALFDSDIDLDDEEYDYVVLSGREFLIKLSSRRK